MLLSPAVNANALVPPKSGLIDQAELVLVASETIVPTNYSEGITLSSTGGSGSGAVTFIQVKGECNQFATTGTDIITKGSPTSCVFKAVKASDGIYKEAVSDSVRLYFAAPMPEPVIVKGSISNEDGPISNATIVFSVKGYQSTVDPGSGSLGTTYRLSMTSGQRQPQNYLKVLTDRDGNFVASLTKEIWNYTVIGFDPLNPVDEFPYSTAEESVPALPWKMQYSGTLDLYNPSDISDLNITIKSKVIDLTVKDNLGVIIPEALIYYSAVNSPTDCGAADTLNCLTQYKTDSNGELKIPVYLDECSQCLDSWHKNEMWLNTSGPLQISDSVEPSTPQGVIFASDPQNPAWFGSYSVTAAPNDSVDISLPDPIAISGNVSDTSTLPHVIRFLNTNTGYMNMTTRFTTTKSYSFKASPNQKTVMIATALRSGAEELFWNGSSIVDQIKLNNNFEIPFTTNAQEVEITSTDVDVSVLSIPEHHAVNITVTNKDTLDTEGNALVSPNAKIYLGINEDQNNRANYLNGPSCSYSFFQFIKLCNSYPINLQVDEDGSSALELPKGKQLTAVHSTNTAHFINADVRDMLNFNGALANSQPDFLTDNETLVLELPKSTLLRGNVDSTKGPIENATITFNPYSRIARGSSASLTGLSPAIYGRALTNASGNYEMRVNDSFDPPGVGAGDYFNEAPGIIKLIGYDEQIASEYSVKRYGHGVSNANEIALSPSNPRLPPSLIQTADITPIVTTTGTKVKYNFCTPNCTIYTSPTDPGTVVSASNISSYRSDFNFQTPIASLLKIKVFDPNTGVGVPNAVLYTAETGTVPNLYQGKKGGVTDNFQWTADGKNADGIKADENGEILYAAIQPIFAATGIKFVAVDPENPSRKSEVWLAANLSTEYEEVFITLPILPKKPEEIKVESTSSGNVEVDFSESEASLIAPLGGYLVTATPMSELVGGRGFSLKRVVMLPTNSKVLDLDDTKTNLTELVAGKRYRISVAGWNVSGIGQKIETIYPPLPVTPPSSSGGGSRGPTQSINPNLLSNVPKLLFSNPLNIRDSFFKSLNSSQIGSISVSQFAKLPMKTIALLSPSQADALTFDQLKALKPSQVVALKPSVIAVLDSTQIAALQPADFRLMKTTQIARISAEAAAGLAKADLNAFTQTQLRSLTTRAVKNLEPEVLKSLSINKLRQFSPRQIRSLTDEQKSVLTRSQKKALGIK
jgi:hypothetical protein